MSRMDTTGLEAPFLGLRYFDEEHSHLFFGRDEQVNDILERLRRSRLVMVMGSSGSGKSSLVRAGVLPRLKAGFLGEMGSRWRIVKMRPGSSPIASLAREMQKSLAVDGVEVTLRRGPLGLVQAIRECRLPKEHSVLVIADQFEELFRYQRESQEPEKTKEEAASFVKLLLEATNQSELPIYVIATMRSDYLGNCAQFRDLPERINDGLYLVPRMRRDQLEQAIAGPVAVEDAEIAPRLVQKLLNDTGDDPDQLPILQHTLLRTWNTWNHAARPLDLEDLGEGGMQHDLSLHADEIYAMLTADQQRIAQVLFQQLCERDAEGREIRRPAPVTLIAAVAGTTTEAVEDVVAKFAAPDAALLYRNEEGHLDITHESLIRKWTRIQGEKRNGVDTKGWMQEEVEARDQFRLLVERAAKNDPLMGRALDDAIKWRSLGLNEHWSSRYGKVGGRDTATLQGVLQFIGTCEKEEMARRRRRKSLITGGVTALLVALSVFARLWWTAADAATRAENERRGALAAEIRAKTSEEEAKVNETAALIGKQEANLQRENADRQARAASVALSQASTQEGVRLVEVSQPAQALAHFARALRSDPDSLAARSWISDLLLNERVWVTGTRIEHSRGYKATFSPDGRRIVTISSDNTALVWDAATGQLLRAYADAEELSPDGRHVVIASSEGTARVWDTAAGQPVGVPFPLRGTSVLSLSADGRRVVIATSDDTAQVWDTTSGQPVGIPFPVRGATVFSADGRLVVTASGDAARIWSAATGLQVGGPLEHQAYVNMAALSPDGRRVVTASQDSTARLWDAVTGLPVTDPLRHSEDSYVRSAAFSQDGRFVVTASADKTARIWDAATGKEIGDPLEHPAGVHSAAFSPDGRRIVTTSDDGTARVWDIATRHVVGAPFQYPGSDFDINRRRVAPSIGSAAFSPDGSRVLTLSGNTARVWDTATREPDALFRYQNLVDGVVFSPDGHRVVTFSGKSARVWNPTTGRPVGDPIQQQDNIRAAAVNSNGQVITVSQDGPVRIFDGATGRLVRDFLQQQDRVLAAAINSQGRVITVSGDGTLRIFDAATGRPVVSAVRPRNFVSDVVFSLDGRRFITTSFVPRRVGDRAADDNTAQVWDSATGRTVGPPLQHQDRVELFRFTPDGRRIITASGTTARIWNATTGERVGTPLEHRDSVGAAGFSSDGLRVVTASGNTARIWDATTGQPVGDPLQHESSVTVATFSPDGLRVITTSPDTPARAWRVLLNLSSSETAPLLADLAEVVGGNRVTELGSVVPLEEPERLQRVRRLAGPNATAYMPLELLLRRFLPTAR